MTTYQVYCAFRRAQGESKGTGFRLPKSWEDQQKKMTQQNLDALQKTADYFNTVFSNIDLETYMKCGFELYKGFTYAMFLKKEVIQLYINKDKSKKRRMESSKETIDDTFDNISEYLSSRTLHKGYSKLQSFCKFRDGEIRDVVTLYNQSKVDQMTLVYCMTKKYITMSDDEMALVPYITQRYRTLVSNLNDIKEYIIQKEKELEEN